MWQLSRSWYGLSGVYISHRACGCCCPPTDGRGASRLRPADPEAEADDEDGGSTVHFRDDANTGGSAGTGAGAGATRLSRLVLLGGLYITRSSSAAAASVMA